MPEPNEFEQNPQDVNDAQSPVQESSSNDETSASEEVLDVQKSSANGDVQPEEKSESETEEVQGSKTLEEALEKFDVKLPAKTIRLLDEYCNLLWDWNTKLNLTRHTSYDKFVSRDLIDSIHMAALLQKGEHVLDVGSGGGVPGLVVAILRPDVVVELCEATGKKATALGDMIDKLDLNVNVWYSKAQDLVRERHFHTLTIRAVDRLCKLLEMFRTSWHCFNRILLIKGPRWIAERGEARHYNLFNTLALRKIDEYSVPIQGEEFTSVILQVCPKKKLDELKERAEELAEGKPYAGAVEEIVVDNRTYDGGRFKRGRGRGNAHGGEGRESRRRSRAYITAKSDRASSPSSDSNDGDARVYARRNGKPPKGWVGKKSEFHEQAQGGERQPRSNSGKKDWRSNDKKSGFKKRSPRDGNNQK